MVLAVRKMKTAYTAILVSCATAFAASDVVLDATFGPAVQGWRFRAPTGTSVRVVPADALGGAGMCVEVVDKSPTQTASASCPIPTVWVGEAVFRMRAAQTDHYFTVGTSSAYTWLYRGGSFKYNAGQGDTSYPNPIEYSANKWMNVALRWNAFDKTIGLSVDGQVLGEGIPYPRVVPASSVYFSSAGSRGRSQPTFWVDRVTVRRLDAGLPGGILVLHNAKRARHFRRPIWPCDAGEMDVEIIAFEDLPDMKLTFEPKASAPGIDTTIQLEKAGSQRATPLLRLPLHKWQMANVMLRWTSGPDLRGPVGLALTSSSRGKQTPQLVIECEPVKLRPIRPETPIVLNGQPAAVIVPPTQPALLDLAALVQSRVEAATGCTVPILAPSDVTGEPAPREHAIAIGNLESNPLLARLYELRRVRCDRGYPGRGGYVVRTVRDPWGTGKNVIALGGSDAEGVRAAVNALLKHVTNCSSLVIPRLMDIKLHPSVEKRIARPNRSAMGHAGWQYYLTGREKFAQKFREKYVRQTRGREGVFDDSETSGLVTVQPHLFIYNAYQVWPLIEDSPVFSRADRAKITRYFLNMVNSREGIRQGGYVADLRKQRPRQNHQTHTAIGIYYMAEYMSKYYSLPDAQDWFANSEKFFAAHDLNSKPACDSNGHQWGASWADVLKYALMSRRYDVFHAGTAREAVDRSLVNTSPLGRLVFTGDMGAFGSPAYNVHMPTAYFHREGKYAYRVSPFGSSGINPAYQTDLPPREPLDHVGIYRARLAPLYYQRALPGSKCGVPHSRTFDKVSMRSGFEPDSHYLILDGIAGGSHSYDDVNTILELWHQRRALLVTGESLYGHSMKHHNGLVVVKDGEGGSLPQVAELLGTWDLDSMGFVSSKLSDYCGIDWTRHVVWRKGRYVLVLDDLVARESGDYSLQWFWRTLGEPKLSGRTYRVLQRAEPHVSPPKGAVVFRSAKVRELSSSSGKTWRHMPEVDALLYRGSKPGDYFELEHEVKKSGTYQVVVGYLRYEDRGVVQLAVDGKSLGEPVDLRSSGVESVQAALGRVALVAGKHRFRFTVTAKPRGSDKAFIAVQYIALCEPRAGGGQEITAPAQDLVTIQCADNVRCSYTSNERMGRLWGAYQHADPVLRILRQAMSLGLGKGQRHVHANLIYLSTESLPLELALSRIDKLTFAVKGDGLDTLVGLSPNPSAPGVFAAGSWGVAATHPRLLPSSMMLCRLRDAAYECSLDRRRITILAKTQDTITPPSGVGYQLDGEPVAAKMADVGIPIGRHVLSVTSFEKALELSQALVRQSQQLVAKSRGMRQDMPEEPPKPLPRRLAALWKSRADAAVLDFRVADLLGRGNKTILVASADKSARALDAQGKLLWAYPTGGEVWAVGSADLDRDGEREVLVGSDDAYLYALNRQGKLLWKHSPPFGHQPWVYWTLYKSKVRKIATGDLDGDGKPEIVLGCGNMRCVAVSPQGKQLWEFRTDHGTCTTLQVADIDGDGRAEIVGGKGIFSSNSHGFLLKGDGTYLGPYYNQGWTSVVCSLLLTDLEGDGIPEAIFGTDRGDNLRVFDARTRQLRWAKCFGDNCEAIAAADLNRDGVKEVISGSASLYVCAYTARGQRLWYTTVSDSVTSIAAGDLDRDGAPEIVVGSVDGSVSVLDAHGETIAMDRSTHAVTKLEIAALRGKDQACIIAARRDGTLTAFRLQ